MAIGTPCGFLSLHEKSGVDRGDNRESVMKQ